MEKAYHREKVPACHRSSFMSSLPGAWSPQVNNPETRQTSEPLKPRHSFTAHPERRIWLLCLSSRRTACCFWAARRSRVLIFVTKMVRFPVRGRQARCKQAAYRFPSLGYTSDRECREELVRPERPRQNDGGRYWSKTRTLARLASTPVRRMLTLGRT